MIGAVKETIKKSAFESSSVIERMPGITHTLADMCKSLLQHKDLNHFAIKKSSTF